MLIHSSTESFCGLSLGLTPDFSKSDLVRSKLNSNPLDNELCNCFRGLEKPLKIKSINADFSLRLMKGSFRGLNSMTLDRTFGGGLKDFGPTLNSLLQVVIDWNIGPSIPRFSIFTMLFS